MSDVDLVSAKLARIRAEKDCQLWPCPYVTDAFISTPPHRVGIAHLMFRTGFVLADPVGTGKSPMALVAFAQLKVKRPALRLLVVTLNSAQLQWRNEAETFLTGLRIEALGFPLPSIGGESHFHTERDHNLLGKSKHCEKKAQTLSPPKIRQHQYETSPADIFITTWDQMVKDMKVLEAQLWIGETLVVFDEIAEKARNWEQKTFWPSARRLASKARYAWGLTATPMVHGLDDLFSIFQIVRPGTLCHPGKDIKDTYNQFRHTYYHLDLQTRRIRGGRLKRFYVPRVDATGKVIVKNLPQLQRMIEPFLLKRPASEMNADLPTLLPPKMIRVEMSPAHRAFYDQVVNRWFHPDKVLDSRIDQIAAIGYAQMASDTPRSLGEPIDSNKLEALVEFVAGEAHDEKIIIFTRYTSVLAEVRHRLAREGVSMVQITGDESKTQREEARQVFWGRPDCRVMGITSAGGQALNLQVARIIVFVDLPWNWGSYVQILGRSRRIGSKFPQVMPVLLLNRDTIDEHTVHIVKRKKGLTEDTIGLDADESLQFTDEPPGASQLTPQEQRESLPVQRETRLPTGSELEEEEEEEQVADQTGLDALIRRLRRRSP